MDKFKKLKGMMSKHVGKKTYQHPMKASAELEASKNPDEYMKKMKNPSIRKLKGIAL